MTERGAILLAGGAHIALLAALSLSWAMRDALPPSFAEAVPVEVVEIGDVPAVTEIPKPSMEAAPRETVEAAAPDPAPEDAAAPTPEPLADAPPPPPAPAPAPAPTPAPEPEPVAKPTPPKASPKAAAKPKPATEAVKKAPQRMDAQELTDLLDKSLPKARTRPRETADFAKSIEKAIPKGARLDARAVASLEQALRAQILPCFNPPVGGRDVEEMTVTLRVEYSRDGRVVGTPQIVDRSGSGDDGYARALADSALRAVLRCQPIELPAEYYDDGWRVSEPRFDPTSGT